MPSLGDILALRALALEPVTVPDPGAEARWVTTSELPNPSQFLEGGEILLTTGLIERSDDDWRLFAERMLEAGVVAVGFGVGLSHPTVPVALHDAAGELGLNLFVVPRRVPFIAVSRAVADLIWSTEREIDRLALQHQRDLTTAALQGTEHLLGALAVTVAGEAALCSATGELMAGHAPAELLERATPLVRRLARSAGRGASSEVSPGSRLAVHPVGVSHPTDAYLVVESESQHRVAVTTALALLSLDRERARAERDADRRIRSGALSLALRSDVDAARLLLAGSPHPVAFPESHGRVLRARGAAPDLDDALVRIEA
ncbi:MAG TPA: PucR family transcriptional regulator ligand-binding domain-containing protein, partial [Terrimesophilobacter sp.]|nr:PucR family transcriptional regulator ligand-binding domain-containing protein [Terrimesophilobacter sp.]